MQADHRDTLACFLIEQPVFPAVVIDGDVAGGDRALAGQRRHLAAFTGWLETGQDPLHHGRVLRPFDPVSGDQGIAELRDQRLSGVVQWRRTNFGKLLPRRCGHAEAEIPRVVDVGRRPDVEAVVNIPDYAEPCAGDLQENPGSTRRRQSRDDGVFSQP